MRFYSDLDGVWLIVSEFLQGETSSAVSAWPQVFLDIGAHYGFVSARMATTLPHSSRIIAIEAHPANCQVLRRNIEVNDLSNVEAYNFAIANYSGTALLTSGEGPSARQRVTANEEDTNSPRVRAYRMTEVFDEFKIVRADSIKLDIEGLELGVVLDCLPALARRIGEFDIEVHKPTDLGPIQRCLLSNGYVVRIQRSGILSPAYRLVAKEASSSSKSDLS